MTFVLFKDKCHDKYNGKVYNRGDVVEFEDDRAKEIESTGYGEIVDIDVEKTLKDAEAPEEVEETEEVEESEDDHPQSLESATVKTLREMCKERGIDTKGKKQELIDRLNAYKPE